MLLSLTTTHQPATDLGYLLHKHPDHVQAFTLSFGSAQVFYPEADHARCTATLLLDVDPLALSRARRGATSGAPLQPYVNDRPYVASSFLSVALAQVYKSALVGRCDQRPALAETPIPLSACLAALPVRGGAEFVRALFEPLGYSVTMDSAPLDDHFPDWGPSPYVTLTLRATVRLSELLSHLYVLVPVLDNQKHYYVADEEVDKLLRYGAGWLDQHPLREQIARRYLKHRRSLYEDALSRLTLDEQPDSAAADVCGDDAEASIEQPLRLNEQRLAAVLAALRASGARSVVDLGCGEGRLLEALLHEPGIQRIAGMDVSYRAVSRASERLRLEQLPERQRERVSIFQGSLQYRDSRLAGFDAAVLMEVVEHIDPTRLDTFEQVVFGAARPGVVLLTTPDADYNAHWSSLPAGSTRHPDHRFEWTRAELRAWAEVVAARNGYSVTFQPIGPDDALLGAPTQMAVFQRG